jgi:acetyl esterase/lipase
MQLDDAYANAAYIDGAEDYPPRWQKAAAAFRKKLGFRSQKGISYGDSDREVYDFLEPEGVSRGTVVFVHGGYWKAFAPSDWSHLAAGALARGYAVAMIGYDLCPDVRISRITAQVSKGLIEVAKRTQGPICLAGHSAGGQLVARMMDPLVLPGDVRERISNIVSISPVADLMPLLQTSMNEILQLTDTEATAESPVNMTPPHGVNVTIWVGADERPAFIEQAEQFSRVWGAKLTAVQARHHFDIIDLLEDPESDMMKALLGIK